MEEQASKLRKFKEEEKTQKESEEKKQTEAVEKGEVATSSGKCRLENLAPHLLKFLDKEVKKQDVTVHEIKPDADDTESTQQAQQPPPQQKVFVQKAHGTQGVILVESVPQKSTECHLGKTRPVDPNL